MQYQESDLPVTLKEGEEIILAGGTEVRFEDAGGAFDVMVGGEFTPRTTLFESNEYTLEIGGKNYKCTAMADGLKVEAG